MTSKLNPAPGTERDGRPIARTVGREMLALARAARQLDAWGCLPATAGNFSVRNVDGAVWVSRSGIHKRNLQASDFISVNDSGGSRLPIVGKTSDETLVHLAIYQWIPAARAILHAHPPELEQLASPAACTSVNSLTLRLQPHELLKALGVSDHSTPLFVSGIPNTQDMESVASIVKGFGAAGVSPFPLKGAGALVLLNHGIYVAGPTARQALWVFEALQFLLRNRQIVLS